MRQGNRWWLVVLVVLGMLAVVPTLADAQRVENKTGFAPVPQGRYAPSTGHAPLDAAPPDTAPLPTNAPLLAPFAVAYRFTFSDTFIVSLDVTTPGSQAPIGPTARSLFSGDFANNDFSRLLVIDTNTNEYLAIDTATGIETLLGSSIPIEGHTWTGMAWDPTTGVMYGSASSCMESSLYTIDIATGAATLIGLVNDAGCLIDIAVSPGGQLYGVDILNDWFMAIDKSTGAATVIGSIGFDANFAQDLDFDDATGVLYFAAFNNTSFLGELYTIDVASGTPSYIGAFGTETTEIDAFGIVSSIAVPTATPEPPTATPEPPTATPEEPSATPELPSPTPEEPSPTPEDPGATATPEDPVPTPTLTPIVPEATPTVKVTIPPNATATEPAPPGSTNTPVPLPSMTTTPGGNPTITVPTATPRPTMTRTPGAPSNGVSLLYMPLTLENFKGVGSGPIPPQTATPVPTCLTREQEPNNSLNEAMDLPVLCEGVTLLGTGTFFTDSNDPERYDVYHLEVPVSITLSVVLDSLPSADPDFDLLLLDENGAIVAAAQEPGDNCLVKTVPAGSYYIAVYEDPNAGALGYTLVWRRSLSCS